MSPLWSGAVISSVIRPLNIYQLPNRSCLPPCATCFFHSHNVARSILSSASLMRTHTAKAPSGPLFLCHGATRAKSNRVQWDVIVRVKSISLELDAIDPECSRCKSLYSKRCGCNAGIAISLVASECVLSLTSLHALKPGHPLIASLSNSFWTLQIVLPLLLCHSTVQQVLLLFLLPAKLCCKGRDSLEVTMQCK